MRSPRLRPTLRLHRSTPAGALPLVGLAAALSAGCRTPSVQIEARSEVEVQTNGIGLYLSLIQISEPTRPY